jgi:hypothetical protein
MTCNFVTIHFFLAPSWFVFRGFENLSGRTENKNISQGRFNGQEQQNCYTARTGLEAKLFDVQRAEGEKERSQCFSK